MSTPFHSKYWATELTLRGATGSIESLSRSIAGARVDLNPHQVDAALFALRSPLSRGVILADEVGLGKTIEAGIVLAQRWAERRRRILLIVPATLRMQWRQELEAKFFLPTTILDTKVQNALMRAGLPFAMSMPAITKHLKVLERAGLLTRSQRAQWRPCQLRPEGLQPAAAWLERYRELWEQRFDRLETYLAQLQAPVAAASAKPAQPAPRRRQPGTKKEKPDARSRR